MYDLTVSFHKGTCASAHLGHNRRTIYVPHSDPSRKHLNICYVDMPIEDAYHHLFDNALAEYNKGKKPSRQIKDYYKHILEQYQKGQAKLQEAISSGANKAEQRRIKSKYPKPFYEVIVTVGNSQCYDGAFSSTGENSETTADILNRYMEDFQKRNPHLFVFSAHMHRDEFSNHIHIDYIPWSDLPGRGLPVRVSENGAFTQQGLTSGKTGDYGTVKFQEQERQVLREIAKECGINIVEGKHSKKHLSKEEYILRQEQEKSKVEVEQIDQEAGALLEEQDRFVSFVQNSDHAVSYLEHLENEELRKRCDTLDKAISNAWKEFNQNTSEYFAQYRRQKEHLRQELLRARKNAYNSRKSLHNILYDITSTNDFFIVKIFKLIGAIFVALDNAISEAEVQRLQKANDDLKQLAKDIMSDSQSVSDELRTKDVIRIQEAMSHYEQELQNSLDKINQLTRIHSELRDR